MQLGNYEDLLLSLLFFTNFRMSLKADVFKDFIPLTYNKGGYMEKQRCYFLTRLSSSPFLIMTLRMKVIQADRSSLLVQHTEK